MEGLSAFTVGLSVKIFNEMMMMFKLLWPRKPNPNPKTEGDQVQVVSANRLHAVEQLWSCFGAALFEISLHPIICYLLHLARLPVVLLWHWLHQSEAAHSHWLQLNLHVQVAPLLLGCIALMSLFIWWGGGVKFRQVSALKFDTVSYKYWTFQVHHPIKTLCFSVSYLFLCDFGFYIPITQVLNIEAVYIFVSIKSKK